MCPAPGRYRHPYVYLLEAVGGEAQGCSCSAVEMEDQPEGYRYPDCVRFEMLQDDLIRYHRIAGFLNITSPNAVPARPGWPLPPWPSPPFEKGLRLRHRRPSLCAE